MQRKGNNFRKLTKKWSAVIILATTSMIMLGTIAQLVSVAVYADFFQVKEYRFGTYSPSKIYFHNNNFLSPANFNPLFYGSVKIDESTGNVECFYDVSKNRPCDNTRIDLQKIEAGKAGELPFYLFPDGNDFTITATAYLNLFNQPIELSSESWDCMHTEWEYYWCTTST